MAEQDSQALATDGNGVSQDEERLVGAARESAQLQFAGRGAGPQAHVGSLKPPVAPLGAGPTT